ncbi:MAG: hypothetical protein JO033_19415 [Acidobacteriaceae bacterium]|nr:hypothetical protein [Acidobacteriaceae bacterium]
MQYFSNARLTRICRKILIVLGGPTLLISYGFVLWSLAANLGLNNSFLWTEGPLGNWMIWLIVAALLTLVFRVARLAE